MKVSSERIFNHDNDLFGRVSLNNSSAGVLHHITNIPKDEI